MILESILYWNRYSDDVAFDMLLKSIPGILFILVMVLENRYALEVGVVRIFKSIPHISSDVNGIDKIYSNRYLVRY